MEQDLDLLLKKYPHGTSVIEYELDGEICHRFCMNGSKPRNVSSEVFSGGLSNHLKIVEPKAKFLRCAYK